MQAVNENKYSCTARKQKSIYLKTQKHIYKLYKIETNIRKKSAIINYIIIFIKIKEMYA